MLKSAQVVVAFQIASQVAAFLRTILIAKFLGISSDVDAYNLSLIVPVFFTTVIGSWLQVGYVSQYVGLMSVGKDDQAAAYRSRMLFLIVVASGVIAAISAIMPQTIMALFIPASQVEMITAAAGALRWTALIVVPSLLSDYLALLLNSHRHFLAAAMAPFVNACISAALLLIWPFIDLTALMVTLLIGTFVQLFVVAAAVFKSNLTFSFQNALAKKDVNKTLLLAVPLIPALMLSSSTAAIIQFNLAALGPGSVSTFGYASRFQAAVSQVLAIGLSTVLLPHFAALWAKRELPQIIVVFRRLVRATVFASALLTAGIALMSKDAVGLLLERGAFGARQTDDVSWLWFLLSLSIFPLTFGTFIAKFCQATGGARDILISAAILFAATWSSAKVGTGLNRPELIVIAVTVGALSTLIYWFWWLGSKINTGTLYADLKMSLVRTSVLLVPAILAVVLIKKAMTGAGSATLLAVCGSSFCAVLIGLMLALGYHHWFFLDAPEPPVVPAQSSRS